jgi:hypothetical protein
LLSSSLFLSPVSSVSFSPSIVPPVHSWSRHVTCIALLRHNTLRPGYIPIATYITQTSNLQSEIPWLFVR